MTFFTSDMTAQIGSCFDPIVYISSNFLKHSTTIFFMQLLILNLKIDLTVHIDLQRIYDDPTVKFQQKSNPTIKIKSQRVFNNLISILTSINSINTHKIIQFSL